MSPKRAELEGKETSENSSEKGNGRLDQYPSGNELPFLTKRTGVNSGYIYFGIAATGFFSHVGAIWLTFLIIGINIGREANPIFYFLGPWMFAVFGITIIIAYYFCVWKINVPIRVKLICAGVMTLMSMFDFMHDFAFLYAQGGVLHGVLQELAKIIVQTTATPMAVALITQSVLFFLGLPFRNR